MSGLLPEEPEESRGRARQAAVSMLFRLMDEQRLHFENPDADVLDEVIDCIFSSNTNIMSRDESAALVSEVWGKVVAWGQGEED